MPLANCSRRAFIRIDAHGCNTSIIIALCTSDTCKHVHTYTDTHTLTQTCKRHKNTLTHTYTYICIHTRTWKHAHTHTHIHTHTHSHPQRFRWYDKGAEVAELYIDYLTHLLSAQTYYLQSSLQSLVSVLFSRYPLPPAPAPPSEGGRGLGEAVGETKVYLNVHDALLAVLHIVPTAPSVLMPLLNKRFPFKGKSAELQVSLAVPGVASSPGYPLLRPKPRRKAWGGLGTRVAR